MTRKTVTSAFVGFAVLACAVLWMRHKSSRDVARLDGANATTNEESSIQPRPGEDGFPAERRALGRDEFIPTAEQSRSAVAVLHRFATTAALYNYDPALFGVIAQTSRHRSDWLSFNVQTRSHVAMIINGHLISAQSLYDGSDTRRRPEAMNDWYQATGTLSKDNAIQSTFTLLTKFHGESALEELKSGGAEFRAEPITVKAPDGQFVRVTPFRTLRLSDTAGVGRVTVEFRMGPTGSVGITKWFNP